MLVLPDAHTLSLIFPTPTFIMYLSHLIPSPHTSFPGGMLYNVDALNQVSFYSRVSQRPFSPFLVFDTLTLAKGFVARSYQRNHCGRLAGSGFSDYPIMHSIPDLGSVPVILPDGAVRVRAMLYPTFRTLPRDT